MSVNDDFVDIVLPLLSDLPEADLRSYRALLKGQPAPVEDPSPAGLVIAEYDFAFDMYRPVWAAALLVFGSAAIIIGALANVFDRGFGWPVLLVGFASIVSAVPVEVFRFSRWWRNRPGGSVY